MNRKGFVVNPVLLIGAGVLLVSIVALFSLGLFPAIDFNLWSLQHILCGGFGVPPVFNLLDPVTWLPAVGYAVCTTALPVIAAIVLGIIAVLWFLGVFPAGSAFPPLLFVIFLVGAVLGYVISNFVLSYWWLLIALGLAVFVIRMKIGV